MYSQLKISENIQTNVKDNVKELKKLETDYVAYEKYLDAVNKNGVPFQIIKEALPKIESEVNNILSQMVEFTVSMDTDGYNIVSHIVYSDENKWSIELTSGAERFITGIALRAAFINISSLPRPNFLAIDEGLGSLDAGNLNSIYLLFDYLKQIFKFTIVISHLDSARDIVDNFIPINKKDGRSHINFK